jgi:hypothetical protein
MKVMQLIFVHATCKWWAMAKIKHAKLSYINDNKNREQAQIIYTCYCRILIDSSLWWFWANITALVRKQCGLFLLFKSMDKMTMWRFALVHGKLYFYSHFWVQVCGFVLTDQYHHQYSSLKITNHCSLCQHSCKNFLISSIQEPVC